MVLIFSQIKKLEAVLILIEQVKILYDWIGQIL